MHLEGALTPRLLFELASKNDIELPPDDVAFSSVAALVERYNKFTSLDDFLQYYYIGMSVLITESDFEALAWDYFEHAVRDGVAHAGLVRRPNEDIVNANVLCRSLFRSPSAPFSRCLV